MVYSRHRHCDIARVGLRYIGLSTRQGLIAFQRLYGLDEGPYCGFRNDAGGKTLIQIVIADADDGKQIHKWLRLLLPGMPLSGIHKFIRTGRIKVNGKRGKRDTVLHAGDTVNLYMTDEDYAASRKPKREKYAGVKSNVDVRYEDDEVVIVNKPAGILVHAADGDYASTLQAQVEAYVYRKRDTAEGQAFTPAPVHRLDRNTTGLVIFAKTSRAARELAEAFQSGRIEKTYLALVAGTVRKAGRVTAALARVSDEVTAVTAQGKESATNYVPISAAGGTTLMKIHLETGRTHQIRAHMAHIRHPLVGDVKYGARREQGNSTFYLHAAQLKKDGDFSVTAPMPRAFAAKLQALGYDLATLDGKL